MQNEIITYTQHTGEVVARGTARAVAPVGLGESTHEACCPTGTREGSRADGFFGAQKTVRARESAHSSAQVGGRSMIEMLGVLAIIGVLSVGALSGYRMAMTKYRANEVVDYAMRVVESALHHGTTQKTGSIPDEGSDRCQNYVNGEEAPFDMDCWIANGSSGGIPIIYFFLGNGSYSAELGTSIQKQVGSCDNMRFPCIYPILSCPVWASNLQGQPCAEFIFKR